MACEDKDNVTNLTGVDIYQVENLPLEGKCSCCTNNDADQASGRVDKDVGAGFWGVYWVGGEGNGWNDLCYTKTKLEGVTRVLFTTDKPRYSLGYDGCGSRTMELLDGYTDENKFSAGNGKYISKITMNAAHKATDVVISDNI